MKVYTKKGDGGKTDLGSGQRVPKSDQRIQLLGLLDEANSHMGWVKSQLGDPVLKEEFQKIQEQLMTCMSSMTNPSNPDWQVQQEEIQRLEQAIDFYTDQLPLQTEFIIPGHHPLSAQIHVLRTVIRKSEVAMVDVSQQSQLYEPWKAYINRLSDYLFTVARYVEKYIEIEARVRHTLQDLVQPLSFGLVAAKRVLTMVETEAKKKLNRI